MVAVVVEHVVVSNLVLGTQLIDDLFESVLHHLDLPQEHLMTEFVISSLGVDRDYP